MAEKQINVKVITPDKTVLDRVADFAVIRTVEGEMGVLYDHEPFTAVLDNGVLRTYTDKEQTDLIVLFGGFATMEDNNLVILSSIAESYDKIDELIESIEQERAEKKRIEQQSMLEVHQAENFLRNTLVKMDISSYAITKGNKLGGKQ